MVYVNNASSPTVSEVLLRRFTKTELIIYNCFFSVQVIFGFIFNFILIYLYFKDKKIRESTIIFIPLLALNDISFDLWESFQQIISKYVNLDKISPVICVITFCIGITLSIQSEYFQLITVIYRYVKIKNPLDYHKYLTKKRTLSILFGIFLFSFSMSLLPFLISVLDYTGRGSCKGYYNLKHEYIPLVVLSMLPVLIGILIFYVKILKIAKKHAKSMEIQMKKIKSISASSKANLIQILLTICLWIIFSLALITFVLGKNDIKVKKFMSSITQIMLFQTVFNPIFSIFGNFALKSSLFQLIHVKSPEIRPN